MRFNKLIPEMTVSNLKKSFHFYKDILGFKIEYQRKESKFAFLSYQGAQIMIQERNGVWDTGKLEHPFGRGINFQIETKDIKKLLKSLKQHGYHIFAGLKDNWYRKDRKLLGCREFLVMDPDGYLLRFSQNIGTRTLNPKDI
jgi:catechol 2,3-dioxygenase-like lactoylglutathione lyase family enzyme